MSTKTLFKIIGTALLTVATPPAATVTYVRHKREAIPRWPFRQIGHHREGGVLMYNRLIVVGRPYVSSIVRYLQVD